MSASYKPRSDEERFIWTDADRDEPVNRDDGQRAHGPVIAGIPAYNEELTIGSVVILVGEYVDEVIVVDDGSTDRTAEVASTAGATVLEHEENRGKGAAIRSFVNHLQGLEFDACVLVDADGQHMPADIPEVVEPVINGDADLVIGSRYVEGGYSRGIPLYRRVGQQLLDVVTSIPSQTRLSDSQSGFRALSPEAIRMMSISTNGFGIESEMIVIAAHEQLEIRERPIRVQYTGESTLDPVTHALQVLWVTLKLFRNRGPFLYFGTVGALFVLAGTIFSLNVISTSGIGVADIQFEFMIAQLSLIVGILCLFAGFVVNAISVERTGDDSNR